MQMNQPQEKRGLRIEFLWLLPALVLGFLVYANTLGGEFVYDDLRQIVRNILIQDGSQFWHAMTSDVWWAFNGGEQAVSNYWRPSFVLWMILNFRSFGLDTFGWHLLNILLHLGVCILAYLLSRRWNLSAELAFAVTLIFAVHPVHTESVAWISGSPDLLFSVALLGSFFLADKSKSNQHGDFCFILSLILYAVALGAKEVGVLCFPIYWFILAKHQGESLTDNKPLSFPSPPPTSFLIYPAIAAAYFVLRWRVIGRIALPREDASSLGSAILTVPSIFVFYLRQIFFPFWLGANYPLRPVTEVNFAGFWLPLIISVLAIALLWLIARRSLVQKIGFWLFILPLLPAMNASAFPAEQIVHDRYLYLPLLGFLMVIVPCLSWLIERFATRTAEQITMGIAALICLPLSWQTFHYNRVWLNDVSLWEQTVKIDPASSFNWSQYGAILSERGRIQQAAYAYDKALKIRPTTLVYMGQGRNFLAQKKYEEAVSDLQMVIRMPPEKVNGYVLYQTYEALAIVYLDQRKFDDAINSLEEGRKRLPIYYAALTEKLAVVLYDQGRKDLALTELEQARIRAQTELLPESKTVLMRLGMLYAEQNRNNDAKAALEEYLRLTASMKDKLTIANRAQAARVLRALK